MKLFSPKPSITSAEAAAGLGARQLVPVDIRQPGEWTAFLCHSGVRSTRATSITVKAGYDAVNVRGGMTARNRPSLPLSR